MRNWLKSFIDVYKGHFVAGGVLGNFMFLIGSALFLSDTTQTMGVWLFICGSGLMLLNSSASALSDYLPHEGVEAKRRRSDRISPSNKKNYTRDTGSGTKIAT